MRWLLTLCSLPLLLALAALADDHHAAAAVQALSGSSQPLIAGAADAAVASCPSTSAAVAAGLSDCVAAAPPRAAGGCPAGQHAASLRTYILSLPCFNLTRPLSGGGLLELRFALADAPAYMSLLLNRGSGGLH